MEITTTNWTEPSNIIGVNPGGLGVAKPRFWAVSRRGPQGGRGRVVKYYYMLLCVIMHSKYFGKW